MVADETRRTIYLLDDHPAIRAGLKAEIESHPFLRVIGESASVSDTLRDLPRLRPHILITDISLAKNDTLSSLNDFRKSTPDIKIVVWTMHRDWNYLKQAAESGVSAYLLKEEELPIVVRSLERVVEGDRIFPTGFDPGASLLPGDDIIVQRLRKLTDREKDVLQLVGKGFMNKEVADKLGLSVRTVEKHRATLMEKLHCKSAVELAVFFNRLR